MIVNAYAVLDAFLSVCRLGLGLTIMCLSLAAGWTWLRLPPVAECRKVLEDRCYLLFLLAHLLLWLNLLSWPILYLLLQSYVPEWPGVMCIYGVTRIGAGTAGAARFLPPLLTVLQGVKPALVFLSGAWFVLYVVSRGTRTAPLTGRILLVLVVLGVLAVSDAAAEITYLAIPKKEVVVSGGCCTVAFDEGARITSLLPETDDKDSETGQLYGLYYGINVVMVLALAACGWWCPARALRWWLPLLVLGTILSLVVNAAFLVDVAAPHLLHLPYHHCPYDLIPQVPESLVAVALFVGGSFAVGWAGVAGWLGNIAEARDFLPVMIGRLLRIGFYGYLASMLMLSLELALA
jgi:hypothetical protein